MVAPEATAFAGPAGRTGHGGLGLRADSATRKEGKEGRKKSDRKSNNPHLTGGKKMVRK